MGNRVGVESWEFDSLTILATESWKLGVERKIFRLRDVESGVWEFGDLWGLVVGSPTP